MRDIEDPSDNSTDLQDTSGSSSFSSSETIEESEELIRGKSNRGRPRYQPEPTNRTAAMPDLLRALEAEVDISLSTPLTSEPLHPIATVSTVAPDTSLSGGRIMLPLSPFLKPRIHFPISPPDALSPDAALHARITNYQYINKGLAATIQYQLYLNNLLMMNKMAVPHPTTTPPTPATTTAPASPAPSSVLGTPISTTIGMDGPGDVRRRPRRRTAARPAPESSDESSAAESESDSLLDSPDDPVEKILSHRSEDDHFYVKYRGKSYLHCDWVPRLALTETKTGELRLRRFLRQEKAEPEPGAPLFDPALVEVERVIAEEEEVIHTDPGLPTPGSTDPPVPNTTTRKIYLIKWAKFPYESATFEYYDHVSDCEGFETAHGEFVARRTAAGLPANPLAWRPSRDRLLVASPVGRQLRPYQQEGVAWLVNKWLFRQSCILADEMGLGKTVQSATFLETVVARAGTRRPALIVAPLSTLPHWERELAAWTSLRVLTYHGSAAAREIIADFEMRRNDGALLFDVLLTTYEMAIAGTDTLAQIAFGVAVLDEAHRLKNSKSKAAATLRAIEIDHKVLLSGTPLQNNLGELWSLLNFIDPLRFPSLRTFLSTHKMEEVGDVERIQNLLKPLMLRRMKDDVESIPGKEETIVEVELTMIQKRFYRAILEKNMEFLGAGSSAPNLLNIMMELRKCCIHPYLISGAETQILLENGAAEGDTDAYFRVMVNASGKLVFLDKLLKKLAGSHKVLVFSQMTKCLDLVAEYLAWAGYAFERIDGTVRGDVRQAAIDRFSSDPDSFVFLLCTRAGGVGINLTAADTVIIFDSDWNPQNDLQAQARCHRIGQTVPVKIYRLVTRNTYEREMFDRASMKLGLDRAVLHRERERETPSGRKGRVESLLKKGAYGVLMEADEVNEQFCNEDIDAILEGRTRVVRTADQSGNIFSKASFQVAEEIDDPDFWENLLVKRQAAAAEATLRRLLRKMGKASLMNEADVLARVGAGGALEMELRGTLPDRDEAARIIRVALGAMPNGGAGASVGLEWAGAPEVGELPAEVDPGRLLFRASVLAVFKGYEENRGATEIEWKGWSVDDDDALVAQVRANGYGVYDWGVKRSGGRAGALYRGRTADELNARVRKLLAASSRRSESEEASGSVAAAIEAFGRPTAANREALVRTYRGRNIITEMTSMIGTIEENMKRRQSRRSGFDSELAKVLTTRVALFDRLASGTVPSLRKSAGLPRGWGRARDEELVEALLAGGLTKEAVDGLGISEEVALRRAEALARNMSIRVEEPETTASDS
ncbi:hypothetical protein NEHOM01_1036 [Nematocida homosporus]|uniref:uncharacterized protein n=1 Tax=Nematocida homosporus TaxID=1912981 RepID=UPI002220A6D3|nr:uncharacterized protein NEHOM01_1036 [Nematocida homosporus]KAI5185744.1 hypothetical protein NEHOM01_1036 [Nematocida homosporus]